MFLEAENLSHRLADGRYAIRDVSVGFDPGSLTVLAGKNGAGKTIFVRHLNGLLRPASGNVLLDGRPVSSYGSRIGTFVGMVFQDSDSQFVGQTVREDVAFGPENVLGDRSSIDRVVSDAVAALGLTGMESRDPHTLSGGEKRRLALAGVYALHPRIIICDEPFTNLDYPGVVQVARALLSLQARGCGIIVVTHEIEKILAHADRLVIFDSGRLVEDATPGELLSRIHLYGLRPARALASMTWLS